MGYTGNGRCGAIARRLPSRCEQTKEALVYHSMTEGTGGWLWLWMVPMMLVWVAVLGGVVYGAVRVAVQHARRPASSDTLRGYTGERNPR